jgi:AcrR family transcriptional regulator
MIARATAVPSGESPSTRDLILDAAERRFAARGFTGVSVREIATEAGLKNQASLYHHFRDKQALYEAVLARGVGPIVALLAETGVAAGDDGAALTAEMVERVIDRLLDYLEAHPHLPRLIQRAALDDTRRLRTTFARLLRPLYAQGLRVLGGTPWEPQALPHVAAAIHHLIFGWFAGAPLLEVVVQHDPLAGAALARQRRFLKAAIGQLLGLRPARLRPARRRH